MCKKGGENNLNVINHILLLYFVYCLNCYVVYAIFTYHAVSATRLDQLGEYITVLSLHEWQV
jgi:hypothetical protein